MTRVEFMANHWRYYLMLEKKFINTLSYVELSEDNFDTYSNEYAHLLQAIGAELDSFFKIYCNFDPNQLKDIRDYRTTVLIRYPEIEYQIVDMPEYLISFTPFADWSRSHSAGKLIWWQAYNNIEHHRVESKKDASLKNVFTILGALYLLEIKYLGEITQGTKDPDTPDEPSSIFTLRNWNYRTFSFGNSFFTERIENDAIFGGGGA